jgi:hypothetical protein
MAKSREEMNMVNSGLQIREQGYRRASQVNDYFVTGLSVLLFLATGLFFDVGQEPVLRVLDAAAIVLFALAVVAGLKKLEYYVAVLGADYTVGLTQADQNNLTVRETTSVVRDLHDTVERLSTKASVVHRLRNWLLILGIFTVIVSRLLEVAQFS